MRELSVDWSGSEIYCKVESQREETCFSGIFFCYFIVQTHLAKVEIARPHVCHLFIIAMTVWATYQKGSYFLIAPFKPPVHFVLMFLTASSKSLAPFLYLQAHNVQWSAVCSLPHHKQTTPEFVCDLTETGSSTGSQSFSSGPHPSVVAAFTAAQMIRTKGVRNAPGFISTALNEAGV